MNEKEFFAFLDERKQATLNEVQALIKDGRTDEAIILKAKSNIYDISKAVYNANFKLSGGNIKEAFPPAFDKITAPWKASLDAAKAHGDEKKTLIEEAKLSAVSEINTKFKELA